MPCKRLVFTLLILLIPAIAAAMDDLDDSWFEDDLQARIAAVNGGDLVFLSEATFGAGPSPP